MNDELLLKQARLVSEIGRCGDKLHRHFMDGCPEAANLALNGIFAGVDALRETVRAQPYYPAMNESVTVQGVVTEVYENAVKIQVGEGLADYVFVNPAKVTVRPV